MIIARIVGGLGNQLFIYAAARRLALANNVPLKLDIESGFRWDTAYKRQYLLGHFNIEAEIASPRESCITPVGRIRRFILRKANKYLPFEKRSYITEESNKYDSRLSKMRIQGSTYLEGYWQSEKYFKDIEQVIRDDFKIKVLLEETTLQEETHIRNEEQPVCVGIRFFQEVNRAGKHKALSAAYYQKAINIMCSEIQNPHFFIFCNDIDLVKMKYKLSVPHTYISPKAENDRAVQDLWLMTQCKHFIITNSTFHWWGAWLSDNPVKKIIAPVPELIGTSVDYIPESWTKIVA